VLIARCRQRNPQQVSEDLARNQPIWPISFDGQSNLPSHAAVW
jgi:hypothetical protein